MEIHQRIINEDHYIGNDRQSKTVRDVMLISGFDVKAIFKVTIKLDRYEPVNSLLKVETLKEGVFRPYIDLDGINTDFRPLIEHSAKTENEVLTQLEEVYNELMKRVENLWTSELDMM